MVDIEGTISRLLNPVEKFSPFIGVGAELLADNGILIDSLTQLSHGNVHTPEWSNLAASVTDRYGLPWLVAAVAGYFLKDATSNTTLKKIGTTMQNAGASFVVARTAILGLYYSTHSPVYPTSGPQSGSAYRGSTLNSNPTAGGAYGAHAPPRIIGN